MNGFDFAGWLQVVLPTAALLAGINVSAIQGLGKWVSGTAQTVTAGVVGLALGFGAGIAFFGVPSDFLGWFLNVVYGLLVFGVSVGTYETMKSAVRKANGS